MPKDEKETMWKLEKEVEESVKDLFEEKLKQMDCEDLKDIDDSEMTDELFEIADQAVPTYYSDLLDVAADDNDIALAEPEIGPAFDGKPTPINIIAANIFERLEETAHDKWKELVDDLQCKSKDEDED